MHACMRLGTRMCTAHVHIAWSGMLLHCHVITTLVLFSAAQLLACIGEQFTEGDEVCGIVVNVRAKQDKLCIWTRTAANEAAQARSLFLAKAGHQDDGRL